MVSTPPAKTRVGILDAMRGLAILIMIADHIFSALESVGVESNIVEYSRLTATRLSMPLFMIASGIVWAAYGLRLKRWGQVL
ncbi:MAG: acyltransferase family protein, partial [Actinomycetota bacterium]